MEAVVSFSTGVTQGDNYPRVRDTSRLYEDNPLHELDGRKLDAVIHGGGCNKVEDAGFGLGEGVPLLAMCAVGTSVRD